jgi:UDP-N-acetylglucosamine 2-epimerase (non-hydrolysing)
MKKILIIAGTRPEAIKLVPVYKEFRKVKNWNTLLISTGQHKQMLLSVFSFFEVTPDLNLQVMTKNQTLDQLTATLLIKCASLYDQLQPDLIIVQGDTTTAMAAALAAYYKKIKIAHIEAGLRSFDIQSPFPEEANRRMISLLADFNFAPTNLSAKAIRKEGVHGKTFVVGNTVIDSLLIARKRIRGQSRSLRKRYALQLNGFKKMILITGHRRENFGDGLIQICDAIRILAKRYQEISFVYPVHLNPNVTLPVHKSLGQSKNVFLIDPVPYDEMVFLMMESYLILTDSGGMQEEAPSLGKPVIIMRSKTERPEGIKAGCSILAGTSKTKIVQLVSKFIENKAVYSRMTKSVNPYGHGDSSLKISRILKKHLL